MTLFVCATSIFLLIINSDFGCKIIQLLQFPLFKFFSSTMSNVSLLFILTVSRMEVVFSLFSSSGMTLNVGSRSIRSTTRVIYISWLILQIVLLICLAMIILSRLLNTNCNVMYNCIIIIHKIELKNKMGFLEDDAVEGRVRYV